MSDTISQRCGLVAQPQSQVAELEVQAKKDTDQVAATTNKLQT